MKLDTAEHMKTEIVKVEFENGGKFADCKCSTFFGNCKKNKEFIQKTLLNRF